MKTFKKSHGLLLNENKYEQMNLCTQKGIKHFITELVDLTFLLLFYAFGKYDLEGKFLIICHILPLNTS